MSLQTGRPGTLLLRPATPEDVPVLGRVCYEAFRAIAQAHNYPPDFPSPEVASGLLGTFISHPGFYSVVAERDGVILGSNFLDERNPIFGVGPITVTPEAQNQQVGRRLMEAVLRRSRDLSAPGTRLVQAGYHLRSLALYTKLGYDPRETLACLQGELPRSPVPARTVRPATESDIEACRRLSTHTLGFDRTGEVKDAIQQGSATVVETDGRISGYATAVAFFGHQVGESNMDIQALVTAAPRIEGPGMLVPARNAELLRWALSSGLRIIQTMTLMSTGDYADPRGAYVASIFF